MGMQVSAYPAPRIEHTLQPRTHNRPLARLHLYLPEHRAVLRAATYEDLVFTRRENLLEAPRLRISKIADQPFPRFRKEVRVRCAVSSPELDFAGQGIASLIGDCCREACLRPNSYCELSPALLRNRPMLCLPTVSLYDKLILAFGSRKASVPSLSVQPIPYSFPSLNTLMQASGTAPPESDTLTRRERVWIPSILHAISLTSKRSLPGKINSLTLQDSPRSRNTRFFLPPVQWI